MIPASLLLLALPAVTEPTSDVMAFRVGRAETIAHGAIEHAVVLVEDGKITVVDQDLPIERGIPVLDRPDWVLMPGLVDCHSQAGVSRNGSSSSEPHVKVSGELYARQEIYTDLLELGVTTLGLVPGGSGIPGQAVAIRPKGETGEDLVVEDSVYLKVILRSNAKSKKMLMEGFEKVDDHDGKVQKAREKWEKDLEKQKKADKKKKDDDEKEDDSKRVPEHFTPPDADPKVQPFIDLREGEMRALMSISKAADFIHLLDALGDEEIEWSLHCPLRDDIDLYEVAEQVGEAAVRVVLEPEITLQPYTRRERNLPREMAEAGAKLALVPRTDSVTGHRNWLMDVGHLVKGGLDRDVALRAVTLEAAAVLGLDERIGSIEKDKDANLLLFDGDPLEPSSRLRMVMLEGEVVYEYEPVYAGGDQ